MIEPDELQRYAVSATGLDLSNTRAVICYNKLYWRRPDTMREYKDADRTRVCLTAAKKLFTVGLFT